MDELLAVVKSNNTINKMLQNCPYYILSQMQLVHMKSKRLHLSQGSSYQYVYIIVSGDIKVFVSEKNGRQILLDIYTEGNLIGEQEAFINKPYSASIENITDCLLIKIPNTVFIEWTQKDASFNYFLIHSLCEQMDELTNRAAKYSLATVKEQVISTIIDLNLTNNDIDKKMLLESISATSRSVYRILNELEHAQLISVNPKTITILNKEKLLIERKKL